MSPDETTRLSEEIASKLSGLSHDAKPVVQRVFDRKEIYHGPEASKGPDLVALSHHGFDLKGAIDRRDIFGTSNALVGMHTYDDALFWSRKRADKALNIVDIAPIILDSLSRDT